MSFNASSSGTAIRVKLNIHSAVVPQMRKAGMFKNTLTEPVTYIKCRIDNAASYNSTGKSRSPTTNPQWDEHLMVTVKPDSLISFKVYSYHKNTPDKILADGQLRIQDVIRNTPPSIETANLEVPLKFPHRSDGTPLEDANANDFAHSTLNIQIKEWPAFVTAVNRLQTTPAPMRPPNRRPNSTHSAAGAAMANVMHSTAGLLDANTRDYSRPTTPTTTSRTATVETATLDTSSLAATPASDLPSHWEARTDPHTHREYYVDHLTRTTHWQRPQPLRDNWERRMDAQQQRVYYVDHVNRTTQWKHPGMQERDSAQVVRQRMDRYNERFLPEHNANRGTGDTSAANSDGVASAANLLGNTSISAQNSPNRVFQSESSTDEQKARLGSLTEDTIVDIDDLDHRFGQLKEPWEHKVQPNTGRAYYVNHLTKTSQWDDPRTFGLELDMKAPRGWTPTWTTEGTRYYINHTTKKTSWDPWASEGVERKHDVYVRKNRNYVEKYSMFTRICSFNTPEGHLKVQLHRDRLFDSAYTYFMDDHHNRHRSQNKAPRHPSEYRKRLFIQFDKEEGLDYGGVSREFFYLVSSDIANPSYGLFEQSPNYSLKINPSSKLAVGEEHLQYYRFVGRVVAICLYHRRFLDCGFSLPFYKRLLNKSIHLSDIADVDEDYYQSLLWIMQNNIDEVDMGLYFAVDQDEMGIITSVDLKQGGSDIEVVEANKEEYVNLMVKWRFERGVQEQMTAICDGIKDIVPIEWLQVFDEHDLEVALCGITKLDVTDWKAHTSYKNYSVDDKQIKWFWLWLERCTETEKARLLQFVTGTCRIPNGGFAELLGSNGPQRFCIEKTGKSSWLPKSHTCFNRLDLPAYTSYETLKEKLFIAITEGFVGFGQE